MTKKPRKSIIIELLKKGVGNQTILKSASTTTMAKLLDEGVHELIPYHSLYKRLVSSRSGEEISLTNLKKIVPRLTTFYNWMRLNSVTFPLPSVTYDEFSSNPSGIQRSSKPWGEVGYFLSALKSKLGENWALKILSLKRDLKTGEKTPRHDLSKVEGVKRLGIPGRQGTVIKLSIAGIDYAIKVARKQTSCGDGSTGGMGYLKQARLQQLAAEWGATCPVYAVHCVPGKREVPFMAMPMMGQRMVDLYPNDEEWSAKHQQEFWNCQLLLDTYVGIAHNDGNCLNVMTDPNGIVKLIDFDRSFLFDRTKILKHGIYINIGFVWIHKCFSSKDSGQVLRTAIQKLFPVITKPYMKPGLGVKCYRGDCRKYDYNAAVFFPPFEIMTPGPAIFAMEETTSQLSREERAVRLFCRDSTLEHWSYLSQSAKRDLLKVAMYCLRVKKGDVKLAQKISKSLIDK